MTGWTIGRKLYSAFGVLTALVTIASGTAVWGGWLLNDALHEAIGHTKEVALTWKLSDTVSGLGGVLRESILDTALGDTSAAAAIDALGPRFDREIAELEAALPSADEKQQAKQAGEALRDWQRIARQVVGLASAGNTDAALALAKEQADPILAAIERTVDTLLAGHAASMVEIDHAAARLRAWTLTVQIAVMILVLLVGAGVGWIVRGVNRVLRDMAVEMRAGAEQVAAASHQVSTSAQSLSQGATQQAASLEETAASMEEIAAMTRQNTSHSERAASLMASVDGQVAQFNQSLQAVVGSMAGIRESGARVSEIIKTIDGIAFQTNLLALNAAVVAARAGEAGKGFAVVADEVRSLAQRSADAARVTAELIAQSGDAAAQGVQRVDQVAAATAEITASVSTVSRLVREVSDASQQQATGIEQVTRAISGLEQVTQGTAATAEESAAAGEELSAQAQTTLRVVEQLAAMVGGESSGARARTDVCWSGEPEASGAHQGAWHGAGTAGVLGGGGHPRGADAAGAGLLRPRGVRPAA